MNTAERLQLTWTEENLLRRLSQAFPQGGRVIVSQFADSGHATRSLVHFALKKATIAGIIETRQMGRKGTMILVRDTDAWAELGKSA